MGSTVTPTGNTKVFCQIKVNSDENANNDVTNQIQQNLEGSTKRKRADNLPTDPGSTKYKRKALNGEEDIFSDNNDETDSSSDNSDDNIVIDANETKQVNSTKDNKQPPIIVTLNSNHDTKTCIINDILTVKCHNCGENHMANDIKYPVCINYINNRNNKSKPKNNTVIINSTNNGVCNTHSPSATSYATAVKSSSTCQCNQPRNPAVIQQQSAKLLHPTVFDNVNDDHKNIKKSEVRMIVDALCAKSIPKVNNKKYKNKTK
ncbi:hypothetical protein PV326_003778, partial [Microctonus aethiopoides]